MSLSSRHSLSSAWNSMGPPPYDSLRSEGLPSLL